MKTFLISLFALFLVACSASPQTHIKKVYIHKLPSHYPEFKFTYKDLTPCDSTGARLKENKKGLYSPEEVMSELGKVESKLYACGNVHQKLINKIKNQVGEYREWKRNMDYDN